MLKTSLRSVVYHFKLKSNWYIYFFRVPKGIDTNPNKEDIKIQFVGVNTLVISDDSTTIITDGFFSRFTSWDMLFGKIEPQKADIQWAVDAIEVLETLKWYFFWWLLLRNNRKNWKRKITINLSI